MRSNSHENEIETLEKANDVSRTDIAKLMAKVYSEHLKLQQELENENENTTLQKKITARLQSTIQFLNTNDDYLSSGVEIMRKDRNDGAFMRDGAKALEALLVPQNSILAQ